ncbi:MAG: Gldg family protein [Opitutales bacterium]
MEHPDKWIRALLIFTALVMVNVLIRLVPGQVDLTEDNIYTLSPGSENLLAKLEEPVTLEFYFSSDVEGLPIRFKNYAARVEALLNQYSKAGGDRVRLVTVNPQPDTEEEEAAIRSGITGQPLATGETFYFGLLVYQGAREEVIPFISPQREALLEYDISRAIYSVQQLVRPRLGLITDLPMISGVDPQMMMGMNPQQVPQDWVVVEELRRSFEIVQVDQADQLKDIDVLAIIHPQGLSQDLQYGIDQFLLAGNPVFAAVDPSSYIQRAERNPQQMMMGGGQQAASDLSALFEAYGIQYDPRYAVGDLGLATPINAGQGRAVRYPAWLTLNDLPTDHPAAADLDTLLLAEAGTFSLHPESDLTVETLLRTSRDNARIMASTLAMTPPDELARQITPDDDTKLLAGVIRGTFPSAFPDGPPPGDDEPGTGEADETDAEGEDAPAGDHLAESEEPATLVLVTDTDFLADMFSVRQVNIFGSTALQPLNDNLAFAANTLEFLAGSEDLISLRGKGSALRPFEKVQALETEAQQEYQAEYEALQAELSRIQSELAALRDQQREDFQLVASPEAAEAIEEFRTREAETRSRLREIRKVLREDIEALDLRLQLLNLLLIPGLITIAGVAYFSRRSKQA